MLATTKCRFKQTAEIEAQIQSLQCIERELKTSFVLIRTRQLNIPNYTLQKDQNI
jgi:hypothetical protein